MGTQVYDVTDTEYLKSVRPSDSRKDILPGAGGKFSEGGSGQVSITVAKVTVSLVIII